MSFSDSTIIFKTQTGKVPAKKINGVLKTPNIRYAISQRFEMPVELPFSDDFMEVSTKTPVCPQNQSDFLDRMIEVAQLNEIRVEEATQFLTIIFPKDSKEDEKLPVVVWIHGGSYEIGNGNIKTSDPTDWVKEQRIIVVAVSYRLGLFGFLGGYDERLANLGLFDILEALKWIKSNISVFGGDENLITLLGQSSGGDAVAHLLLVEDSEKLFQRAIIQSAPLGLRNNRQKMSQEFSNKTKFLKDKEDILEMVAEYKKFVPSIYKYGLKAAMPFGLQYDFPPLVSEKNSMDLWQKRAQKFDVLIGLNDDETAFYLRSSENIKNYLKKGLGKKILDKTIKFTTDKIYGNPAKLFAENLSKGGGNVYLFRIHAKHENNIIGAAHCIDLPFLFGNEKAWKNAALLKNIPWNYIFENGKKIRKIWADFARNGSVDINDKPEILEIQKIVQK